MITFSLNSLFNSCVCAIIYGIVYSLFFAIIQTISVLPNFICRFSKNATSSDRLQIMTKPCSGIVVFVAVLFFFIGFTFLSYYTLDGLIRVYLLLISVLIFYVSNKALYSLVYFLFTLPLRFFLFPIRKIMERKIH